ncbi:hypothetical protein A3H80_04285 [Candidatus Roizmanbacteria bacterium RIFCSPLOWO2_02_FULL_37_19]|uniref:Uncharacterized protein n=1 Tax=Candidatus Roizmanbacteria bacterium RIFCSPHIGHO2_02_FULL_37_24 TaxID=1802037 RepID=A0A1F7GZ90_9BACT|nr:MAG: hypothetical protein A3C24_01530 [Candidatus Roizmanbacteria bacterium RIFCSPHIGHO2_02_FULL_37_24]OGK33699.1 MAG: hypothetical protein A3E10_03210 [Candidatus Roizmanbacteria bacterium RIFCSPHIGHO2_12_FULL_37_23]OGK55155.1 MAG: hypothetical protein A3H80_04285 [Candidatus Roizmanbacteria bacterium RIFCSPLOWO2_02_FULL_37_19]OGK58873.1 MAG: hypothetical protein A3G65_02520 [Candidatus Roizmanbacteria bacterium RIFCSPLOWO2_12_FULL_37_7b]
MEFKIQLPENSKLLVKKGAHISIGDKLYTVENKIDSSVGISTLLGIDPSHIFQHIEVVIGQNVTVGTILATKKKILGKKLVKSELEGTLKSVNSETGELIISTQKHEDQTTKSFFNGNIFDFDASNRLLTISINKGFEFALKEATDNGGGELSYVDESKDVFTLSEDIIKGKILLIGELQSHLVSKLEALDAQGILTIKGTVQTDLPVAKIKMIDDFKKLTQGHYTYILFSVYEKKGIAYN